MTYDKICRGSLIGEAHKNGLYVTPESNVAKRGTHVSSRSYKLETTDPDARRSHPREIETTQTFKTQNWFRHDTHMCEDGDSRVSKNTFSPRFWRQARGLGPAPATLKTQFHPRTKQGVQSESLEKTFVQEEPVATTAKLRSCRPETARSPTYTDSVDWMAFSSARDHFRWATKKEETRHEYLKKKTSSSTLQGGNEEGEYGLTNSVNHIPSKGKKSLSSHTGTDAKKLLRQDPSQPHEGRSKRRHDFSMNSQAPNTDTTHMTRPGHRSSQEVHDALTWNEDDPPIIRKASSKVVVGKVLRDIDFVGRRTATGCLGHALKNTRAAPAGVSPRGDGRDHRNSDTVRAHLSSPDPDRVPKFGPAIAPAADSRIYSYPSGSNIPSSLPKHSSYQQSQQVLLSQNRGIGVFSPFSPLLQFNPALRQSR